MFFLIRSKKKNSQHILLIILLMSITRKGETAYTCVSSRILGFSELFISLKEKEKPFVLIYASDPYLH